MSLTPLVVVAIFIALLIYYREQVYWQWRTRRLLAKLPTPPRMAIPLIGHSYLLTGTPSDFFHYVIDNTILMIEELKQKFGHIWLGPVPLLAIYHPDAAEVILKSSKHIEKSVFYRFLHPWLGTGLLTSNGEKWKQRRRLITPSFHFNILQDFLEIMNKQSRIMIEKINQEYKSGQTIDIGRKVTMCALDIICETAMGQSVNAQIDDQSEYVKGLYRISELIQRRQRNPFLWWDVTYKMLRSGKEHDATLHTLHSFTKSVIEERMKNNLKNKNVSGPMAFLDVLIHAADEDGTKLSLADIQEEVDTFMFEGHDTTSASMTWTIYLIGRHPDVQRRIQDELDEVFGDEVTRSATMEDLRKLHYLEQVIKEALRLFPSVPLMARVTTEDCIIDGYTIPKNLQVVVFNYVLHHNPQVWEDPERFDPDRFSVENLAGRHPFAYIPFSAGPRNCIGQRFALLEEKVILSQILRKYMMTSYDKREDIRMVGDLILRPAVPLSISLTEREK